MPGRHVQLTILPYTKYSRPIAYSMRKKDQNTKVLIISSSGKSFCAGGDLDWMKEQIFSDRKTRIKERINFFE